MTTKTVHLKDLTFLNIFKTWWPLALGWMLMSFEQPIMSAVMAHLPDPTIHLAAYSGVVFPIALIVEAPIIMLLAASTALSKDRASYQRLWNFMMITSGILTVAHVLIAFTPVYYFIAVDLLGAPAEIIEPAKLGLMVMTPWTWAIAYRRFHQGILIRYGYSRAVGSSSAVRLAGIALFLFIGVKIGGLPGLVVGTMAQSASVVVEAIYMGLRARRVVKHELFLEEAQEPLEWKTFAKFYVPLALTSFISLLWQPIGSAALSRMPNPIESLAVWAVISGFLMISRSPGMAYNETTVALLDRPGAFMKLKRFTLMLAIGATILHLTVTGLPLARGWFAGVANLSPELVTMALTSLWLMLPLASFSVVQNWFQGIIVNSKSTRAIPESVMVFLVSVSIFSVLGIAWSGTRGVYITSVAYLLALGLQISWLWYRSRAPRRNLVHRVSGDGAAKSAVEAG
ncbi:MAG: hypothetical protein JW750_00285 [Anaerolineaceae bacterium]|nr:hypothetical protein [Anaerolineaceae bacterium]